MFSLLDENSSNTLLTTYELIAISSPKIASQYLYFENDIFNPFRITSPHVVIIEIDKKQRWAWLESMPINAMPLFKVYPPIDLSIN